MEYEVKDICQMTGLTRRQMYEYREVIKPIAYKNEAGYKIFGDKALNQFRQVAVYKELGFLPYQIKDILARENCLNEDEILLNQIDLLKEKQKRISDMIYIAEKAYEMGSHNINLFSYLGLDISEMAEMLRKEEKKQEYKDFMMKLNELPVEEEKKFFTILKNFVKLKSLSDDEYEEHKKNCISSLEEYFETVLGVNKYLIYNCCLNWLMGGIATRELNEIVGETNAEYIGEIMTDYYADIWLGPFEKYLEEASEVISNGKEIKPNDSSLKKLAAELHKNMIDLFGDYPILALLSTCGALEECFRGKNETDKFLCKEFDLSGNRVVEESHIEQQIIIDALRLYTKEYYALMKDGKEE